MWIVIRYREWWLKSVSIQPGIEQWNKNGTLATNDFSLEKNGYHAEEQEVRKKTVQKGKKGLTFWKTRESVGDYIEDRWAKATHVLDGVDRGSGQDIEHLKTSGRVRSTHVLLSAEGREGSKEDQKASELRERTNWKAERKGRMRTLTKAINWRALTFCRRNGRNKLDHWHERQRENGWYSRPVKCSEES